MNNYLPAFNMGMVIYPPTDINKINRQQNENEV